MDKTETLITPEVTGFAAGLLALRYHSRDEVVFKAMNLQPRVGGKTIRLLALREKMRAQATSRYAQAVYYQTQIKLRQKEVEAIIKKVEAGEQVDNPIEQAQNLQKEIEVLAGLLAKLDTTEAEG